VVAGAALAWASLKPQYGVPLAILMFVRGDCRAVLAGLGLAVGGAALPLAAILRSSSGGLGEFVERVAGSYAAFEEGGLYATAGSVLRIDLSSIPDRLFGAPPPLSVLVMVAAVSLLLGGLGVRGASRLEGGAQGADSASGVIIILTVLTSTYHMAYDTLALWPPLVAVAAGSRDVWREAPAALRVGLCATLALPLANYIATYSMINRFGISGWAWTLVVSLNALSILCALALTLYLTFKKRPVIPAPSPRVPDPVQGHIG
jgi:hypothetical protein